VRFHPIAWLLFAAVASGQTGQTKPMSLAEAKVAPDDSVITINGFCAESAPPTVSCKTIVTRSQFETLTEALQPDMPLSQRLTVANAYARNLRMSAAAKKRGLDKTPAFEEELRFARMQLLSQDLARTLQSEADTISDADFADYYKKHQPSYEQATIARIFIPRGKVNPVALPSHQDPAQDAMMKVAADLRARAVSGEDPDKLQVEAYTAAGFERTNPTTKMEKVRRTSLPPQHEAVLNLKPGEVSQVFSDPAGARFIYKMIDKQTLTLAEARPEIRGEISRQRYRESIKVFQEDVVFNDAYFNPPGNLPSPPPRRSKKGRRTSTSGPQ
jgi:hypothetical protein